MNAAQYGAPMLVPPNRPPVGQPPPLSLQIITPFAGSLFTATSGTERIDDVVNPFW